MSKLLRTFDQLFHDEALQGCIAVLHNFPLNERALNAGGCAALPHHG